MHQVYTIKTLIGRKTISIIFQTPTQKLIPVNYKDCSLSCVCNKMRQMNTDLFSLQFAMASG